MGSRRNVPAAVLLSVLVLAGSGAARPAGHAAARIGAPELRGYPPVLLVAGDSNHAGSSATGDLYLVRADGTGLRVLRSWPDGSADGRVYGASAARWSPGGKQIALMLWYWCGDPCGRLARISADGTGLRRLRVPADIREAVWSSDWRALLTTFQGDELWTVPMRGGKAVRIWHSRDASAADPDWSPLGTHIVVATRRGITKMTRSGREVAALTHDGRDTAPQWSPGGRSIAFIRDLRCYRNPECDGPANLFVVGADGRGLRRLTSKTAVLSFQWAPDGREIAFTSDESTADATLTTVNSVRANGTGRHALTTGGEAAELAWSPDGRKLLFLRSIEGRDGGGELWAMDRDGGRQTRLLFRPRWTVLSAEWGR